MSGLEDGESFSIGRVSKPHCYVTNAAAINAYLLRQHLSKWIDRTPGLWDNPTMTVTADAKRRVVVPGVKPGDIFACEQQDENRFMLVKLTVALPAKKKTRNEILRAIKQSKMSPAMNWEKLRTLTREL